MLVLLIGLIVFFGVHSMRMAAPGWRDKQLAAAEGRWKGLYSIGSLIGLLLIIWGWSIGRPVAPQVYLPPEWGRHAAMLLVWLGLIAIAAAYQPPGRIRAGLRHPFLIGILLWAAGHLLANGDLFGVVVFGCFGLYAIADLIAVARRGEPAPRFSGYRGDAIAILAGTIIYLILVFWLHGFLFGVSPMG